MRKFLLLLICFITYYSYSQSPYGNEWIDPSKPHYKFTIIKEGIYRIPFSFISSNCPEIAASNAVEICIYNKGKQIPIYLSWVSNPISTDFIEFYADKLNGDIDNLLYDDANKQLNPYSSLVKDTNYYYLTIRAGTNSRLIDYSNDTTSISTPYLDYCIATNLLAYKVNYCEGKRWYYSNTEFVFKASYDEGEGWGKNAYSPQTISTPNAIINSENAKLKLRMFGKNDMSHSLEFKLNGNTLGQKQVLGSSLIEYESTFASSFINTTNSSLTITPLNAAPHGYNLGYISLSYPRNLNFSGLGFYRFSFPATSNSTKFQISNYNTTNDAVLYDLTNNTRTTDLASGTHRFLINIQSDNSRLAIAHTGVIENITTANKINFSNINSSQGNFIIVTHKSVQYDTSGLDVINDYKAYKESAAGGSFKVVVAYMDDLQEWFGYGIPKHPLAIRKYLQWAKNTWTITNPQYTLLIGKGNDVINLSAANTTNYSNNLIPSFGYIASDYHYTTMDATHSQFMSIGRISATNGNIVRNYLNKLKEYNAVYFANNASDFTPLNKEFMKWAIHLGGGTGTDQQLEFRNNLKSFATIINDTSYGARVFSVFKNNPDVSQDISSVDLTNRINKGVGLITFFGHSSASLFDVGIGDPATFTNKGKYPIFLANGCNSGYVFGSTASYSEQFINNADKGAIGFVATTNFSLDATLYQYGNEFYNQLAKSKYNTSVGNLMKKTSENLTAGAMNYLKTTPMEFNLNGDPSVMMTQYPKADYYIDNSSLILPNYNINTTMDSFPVKLIVQNLGKALKTQIKIKIERLNKGTAIAYEKTVNAPYFLDTFEISLPVKDQNFGIGVNNFNVMVESDNSIAEMSESNNEIKNVGNLLIEDNDIIPIFPYEYSIISTSTAKLIAMSTLINRPEQVYHFQIDTTENFNSPQLLSYTTSITSEAVVSWLPQLVLKDSVVYYWRVSRDSAGKGYRWNNSSFIYISGQPNGGWNQSHYFQFKKNDYKNIVLNQNRQFQFVNDVKSISVKTKNSTYPYDVEWYLNNARQAAIREGGRITNGLFVIWIDGKSGIAHQSIDSNYGSATWGKYGSIQFGYPGLPREGFVFQDTGNTPTTHPQPNTPWANIILNFLNQVPSGDYLIFYTYKKPVYDKWDNGLVNYFTNAGFIGIQQLVNKTVEAPFIFAYRKNNSSFIPYSVIGKDYTSFTTGEVFISGSWKEGYKESVVIGPTLKWHTLSYQLYPIGSSSLDENKVSLYGIKANKQKDLLASFQSNNVDTSITWIDPNTYLNLQLRLDTKDDKDRTPTQLKYWRIYFEDIGEVAVNNSVNTVPKMRDTIENGDVFTLNFGSETLNNRAFDSLSYNINITQGGQSKTVQGKLQPIVGNSFELYQKNLTMDHYFEGENNVTYEINPASYGYQKEKYEINNYGRAKFYVKSDVENPLLDVTFDGLHIINNELVSATPNIKIVLKDENKFLLLNDTALIQIYLKYPNGSLVPIYFNQSNVAYTLASNSQNNKAEISYHPALTDGTYQLIVKDSDKSGNSSSRNGSFDYKISFKVITKNQISQFFNYPNPFSTSTQFIFTLTGTKVPDFIKIQIITIRGQVVKEIFKEELGPIKLGVNRTQYAWDGKDQYGDILANGVYLYKVTVKNNGQDYPMMDEADFKSITNSSKNLNQYFQDGWGKMVIIR